MVYEYNQLIYKITRNKKIVVKFIAYRPDLDSIVYESKGKLYQEKSKFFDIITHDEIYNFYEKDINRYKRDISYIKNYLNSYKTSYICNLNDVRKTKDKIKEQNNIIFRYRIMNTVTDVELCNDDIKQIKSKIIRLNHERKYYHGNYEYFHDKYIFGLKRIKEYKQKIGKLKKERNEMLIKLSENN